VERDILLKLPQIMGSSPKILKVFREIKKVASKSGDLLISGEPGTYKELIAKAIHNNSQRQKEPFIMVDLSSVPQDLTDRELFGYENNAAEDPKERKTGQMEAAQGGTIFLNEITATDMNFQQKLFSFLKKEPPGLNEKRRHPALRIICSTSGNLKHCVTNGQFQQGLYDILSAIHIKIPPLRERREDILPLGRYFLQETVNKFETGQKEFSKDARDFLVKHDWPGNIREMESTIRKAVIVSNGPVISKKDLLVDDIGSYSIKDFLEEKLRKYLKEMTKLGNCHLYETVMSEVEKSLITIVLKETEGNQLKTSKTLGINRNTLRAKIKEYKVHI
jgi:two-component system, NtrC family, nitrogen regulation response regulator GlnG